MGKVYNLASRFKRKYSFTIASRIRKHSDVIEKILDKALASLNRTDVIKLKESLKKKKKQKEKMLKRNKIIKILNLVLL